MFSGHRTDSKDQEAVAFRCNICGARCTSRKSQLGREIQSCNKCGSTVRFRAVVAALSRELFGRVLLLPDFPTRKEIRGLGMSDWHAYSAVLADRFNYQNTYFDQQPRLDIGNIPHHLQGCFDFVISSDVFEHVPPPVSPAFRNLRRLLKPRGVVVFTAPYTKGQATIEHFPDLYEFTIEEINGTRRLRNITRTGATQVFENLVFHGGAGLTLEMRVFSESALLAEFAGAGFRDVTIQGTGDLQHGIYWQEQWSLPITARAA